MGCSPSAPSTPAVCRFEYARYLAHDDHSGYYGPSGEIVETRRLVWNYYIEYCDGRTSKGGPFLSRQEAALAAAYYWAKHGCENSACVNDL